MKIKFEELTTALRQQDAIMHQRDDEVNKLREDNQNMFKDLKEYAECEESLKFEAHEHKLRRNEMEGLVEDLREKAHHQEIKIRTIQVELDKLRREASLKLESHRFVEQDLDKLRIENETLRDRLIQLETEKANLMNDKERKDRDCKHLQNELNRINAMVHVRIFFIIFSLRLIRTLHHRQLTKITPPLISNSK